MKRVLSVVALLAVVLGVWAMKTHAEPYKIRVASVPLPWAFLVGSAVQFDSSACANPSLASTCGGTIATTVTDTTEWLNLTQYNLPSENGAAAADSLNLLDAMIYATGLTSSDTVSVTIQTAYDPLGPVTTKFSSNVVGASPAYMKGLVRLITNTPSYYARFLVKNADISNAVTRKVSVVPIVTTTP